MKVLDLFKRTAWVSLAVLMLSAGSALADKNSDAMALVRQAYQDVLGRNPDPTGMTIYKNHVLNDGWDLDNLRHDLKKSPEYKNKQADDIIKSAYQDLLNRAPDRQGLEFYRGKIVNDGWDAGNVRNNIKQGDEYKRKHAAD